MEWIDTKYRLPLDNKYVLIYSDKGCFKYGVAWYSQNGKWIKDDREFIGVVTHWMPLPNPPKID